MDAGIAYGFLDQMGNVFVRQSISSDLAIITGDALKQGAEIDFGIMQILLKGVNKTGLIAGTTANFNLAPACFAAERLD